MLSRNSHLFVVFLMFSGLTVKAQWNSNPAINTPVSVVLATDQKNVNIISDTKGGAIISWSDYRNNGLGEVYAQRLDASGNAKWALNGISICSEITDQSGVAMSDDGKGGAILVWNDLRNGNSDVYAQRVDSNGLVLWTTDGIPVVAKASQQKGPKIIGDGTGGAFVVWEDSVGLGYDIYAQYLNSAGVAQWTAGGVAVCSAVNAQVNPKIQSDNTGGIIICWQDKRNGSDYDIMAQRLNSTGVAQWMTNGTFVASLTGTQNNPKMRADGSGGAFIAWQDKRNGTDYDVYIQRLNAAGTGLWTNNGVGVAVSAGGQSAIDMTITNTPGEIIVGWKDDRNGNLDIYAQKLNSSGVAQWTANGVAATTSTAPQINPNLVSDGAGGAIIAWQDSTSTISDIYSQRINSSGIPVWTTNGVAVGTAALDQSAPKNVPDGNGGSIYAFEDLRNGNDMDVYAHRLDANGQSVGIKETEFVKYSTSCFPNPFSSSAVIKFTEKNADASKSTLKIFDLQAKEVNVNSIRTMQGFQIERSGLPAGIYFYNLYLNGSVCGNGKLVITD